MVKSNNMRFKLDDFYEGEREKRPEMPGPMVMFLGTYVLLIHDSSLCSHMPHVPSC